jgi:glyoxylase-like metal-dependent hydrolase (beta-lactamase superfamily II)
MKLKQIILLFNLILFISSANLPSVELQQFIKLGSYKITHINDGGVLVKAKTLYPESTTNFWEQNKDLIDEEGNIFLTFGGFLIETTNKKILMDLGIGPEKIYLKGIGQASGGPFLKNLEKAGVKPEEITDVFFTHLHQDNIGWTSLKKNDKYELTFPNANYWTDKREWEYFVKDLNKEESEINSDLKKRFYEPLKDIIKFAEERKELAPGLTPVESSGHSPGLFILKLEQDRKILWFTSDLFHSVAEFKDIRMFTDLDFSKFVKELRVIILPEFCRPHAFLANARFGKHVFGKLNDVKRNLIWEPCLTKECKFYYDGSTLAFQEDL